MEKAKYINKKGKEVILEITPHSCVRFKERWKAFYPNKPELEDVETEVASWFNKSEQINPKGEEYKKRLKKHGKDTLYFTASPFTFIVQSGVLLTVELSGRDSRHLNKGTSLWRIT